MGYARSGRGFSKPPAGAQIDWGHPFARQLVACWPVNEQGGSAIYETVQLQRGALNSLTWGGGSKGAQLSSSGADASNALAPFPGGIRESGPWAVTVLAKLDTAPALKKLFHLYNSAFSTAATKAVAIGYWWDGGNGFLLTREKWDIGQSNETSCQLSSNPTITTWHWWTFTWDAIASTARIYVDGVDLTAASGSYVAVPATDGFQLSGTGFLAGYASAMSWAFAAVHARYITQVESQQFIVNPYEFLSTPVARKYFVPAAATSSVPVFYHYYARMRA